MVIKNIVNIGLYKFEKIKEVNFLVLCVILFCQNNGYCVDIYFDFFGYYCMCQFFYDGFLCEIRQNFCVWFQELGFCNNIVVRYYYDRFEEEC